MKLGVSVVSRRRTAKTILNAVYGLYAEAEQQIDRITGLNEVQDGCRWHRRHKAPGKLFSHEGIVGRSV